MTKIRLLVVDDHTLFRRGLIALLSLDERFDVSCQAGDIGEPQLRFDDLLRAADAGEIGQPLVGHRHIADIGLDRGKGIVSGEYVVFSQRIEQRRLACVGKTNNAYSQSHRR